MEQLHSIDTHVNELSRRLLDSCVVSNMDKVKWETTLENYYHAQQLLVAAMENHGDVGLKLYQNFDVAYSMLMLHTNIILNNERED